MSDSSGRGASRRSIGRPCVIAFLLLLPFGESPVLGQTRVVRLVSASSSAGSSVQIPVELVSLGDENALGFSVTFSTAFLSSPQATIGAGAPGATLNVNTLQAGSGRVGIGLAMPAGQTISAGVRQVVVLTFQVAAGVGTTGGTLLRFADTPVLREVASASALPLPTAYVGASVAVGRAIRIAGTAGTAGSIVSVPIQLLAQGTENALGFSVNFSAALLGSPQVSLGSGAAGASLNVNTSQSTSGKIGVALALPAGQSFTAGAREVAVLQVTTSAAAAGATAALTFGDQPILREVSDVTAQALPAAYAGGEVAIGPLAIRYGDVDGNGVVDVFDVVVLSGYIVGNVFEGVAPFLGPAASANVKSDSVVDIFDLVVLQGFIVGNVAVLPQ